MELLSRGYEIGILTAIGLVGAIATIHGHITFIMGRYTIGIVKLITITAELIRFTFRRRCKRTRERNNESIIIATQELCIINRGVKVQLLQYKFKLVLTTLGLVLAIFTVFLIITHPQRRNALALGTPEHSNRTWHFHNTRNCKEKRRRHKLITMLVCISCFRSFVSAIDIQLRIPR